MSWKTDEIKETIADLQQELEKQLEWEQDIRSGSETVFADLLHSKQCRYAHEDQCSWFYESWQNPGYARNRYLTKARTLLARAKTLNADPMALVEMMHEIS